MHNNIARNLVEYAKIDFFCIIHEYIKNEIIIMQRCTHYLGSFEQISKNMVVFDPVFVSEITDEHRVKNVEISIWLSKNYENL